MNCCVADFRYKEVINQSDGTRLGCANDVEIDTCSGKIISIVIYGQAKFFGLLGRQPDIKICWDDICVIGEDTILVKFCPPPCHDVRSKKRGRFFDSFFS